MQFLSLTSALLSALALTTSVIALPDGVGAHNGLSLVRARAGSSAKTACDTLPGAANGECVEVYQHENCKGTIVHHIQPNCDTANACHKVTDKPVGSIKSFGDGAYGTACYAYEDEGCTKEIARTGLAVTAGLDKCLNKEGIKSWKCLFDC